ncbi:hypothetical protein ACVIOG_007373 [Rhizobium leguminosarum]
MSRQTKEHDCRCWQRCCLADLDRYRGYRKTGVQKIFTHLLVQLLMSAAQKDGFSFSRTAMECNCNLTFTDEGITSRFVEVCRRDVQIPVSRIFTALEQA